MKIAGIIAEYNPFHNGHAWHVEQTRALTGCEYVVACVAGHFTQRGEPACMSKWARTRMALVCGVDAVFELPTLFAVRTAEAFAQGGVAILGGLGVDCLSFGSELSDMEAINALAALRIHEPESLTRRVRGKLAEGKSHARAWGEAAGEYLNLPSEVINQPNLALAVEYVRAVRELQMALECVAVSRQGAYHDNALGPFASASAIRAALQRGEGSAALRAIPEAARPFAEWDALHAMDDLLLYRLRSMTPGQLADLPDVDEGLEHRLHRLCRAESGRQSLLEALKCKRYTHARLSRILTHALLGMDRELLEANSSPRYARLLGVRVGAEGLLSELSGRTRIPIVSSASDLREEPCFQLECRATDLWALLHDAPEARRAGREYTEKFIRQSV